MPGVIPSESNGLSRGSPSKKNRLSLKFFQKKETKRALDFTDSQENEEKASEYRASEIDQVVPAAQSSPINCEKRENLLPFVGLNNLGNTCYLNSILQVLYFCPGFKSGVKHLFNIISRKKEALKDEANQKDKGNCKEDSLASYELICSLQSLIISVEQLQARFLLNPEKYADELATQPRQLLNTLGEEQIGFELVEKLFQRQLVLRTRCLECESLTERREDFQDISVPVQEDELSKVEESSEISPEPKTEMKTLRWAISQFASVERIVGEDKYFCENCHHYTEAERSLLFDKMPEVVTIHLKCFAASGLEFDCYGGGLSKINTPLLTSLKLSLEEWSTKPTKDSCGLFAVVMHSGITISSGHYTASVKVPDLNSLELDKGNFVVDQMCEIGKPEPLNEEEARGVVENYDDEEVSVRVGGNTQPSKVLNKKNVEAVGLLGGQKSKADSELYNKASNPDKVASTAFAENRNSETNDANGTHESDRNKESSDQTGINISGFENKISYVVQSLKEYEGKWLLFDDSEVKVTEEKDFLNSLSPSTPPTSTPYLLFYKKL
ncbi:LOW QUALITY PROTEIN: ubiquitin carboxyl-terminal hydrolase 1-like [Aotus nancymaae]|uniref:LOW QUALITY PROTEIN: ubiquitin carboxyl-terminal hydrolase 1-like n=1 Tax=Aotus nancymaae TaxID=37293 RepID=UPI0030FEBCB2